MDLWTTGLNSCTVASSASDLPQSISHMDITLASSTAATTPPTMSFFDPWLHCDDLDLGAILHQANTNVVMSTLHPGESPPSPSILSHSEPCSDISARRHQDSGDHLHQLSQVRCKSSEQTIENGQQTASQDDQTFCLDPRQQQLHHLQHHNHHDHHQQQQQQHNQQSDSGDRHLFCQNQNDNNNNSSSDSNGLYHNHRSAILPSDNKRHILSIINNCLPASSLSPTSTLTSDASNTTNSQSDLRHGDPLPIGQHQPQQEQQQQQYNNNQNHVTACNSNSNLSSSQCSRNNSINSNSLSSSLASSPINSLSSNYSSLSPHSSYNHQQQQHHHQKPLMLIDHTVKEETESRLLANPASLLMNQMHQQQHQQQPLASYCFNPDCCTKSGGAPLTQHNHQLLSGICGDEIDLRQSQLQRESASSYNETSQMMAIGSSSQQLQQHHQQIQSKTSSKALTNRQYKTAATTPAFALNGRSLLTDSKLAQQQRQRQKQTKQSSKRSISGAINDLTPIMSDGIDATDTSQKNASQKNTGQKNTGQKNAGQKVRRCRHITDYVLAEEEKRLLIKEGHTDFPMTCQVRPLTKIEERILRKIRRKIRNKKSAQCSRQRKKEYVEDLERKYSAVVRENHELKMLIANMQEQQMQQQQQQQQPQQQQNQDNHFVAFKDEVCVEGQSSNESIDMNWKDIFQRPTTTTTEELQQGGGAHYS